jgi:hypothetical protein
MLSLLAKLFAKKTTEITKVKESTDSWPFPTGTIKDEAPVPTPVIPVATVEEPKKDDKPKTTTATKTTPRARKPRAPRAQ